MAEEHQGNGSWPADLDDSPPDLDLPERPTYRELAQAIISWVFADRKWRPAVVKALEYLRDGQRGHRQETGERLQRIEDAIIRRPSPYPPSVPRFDPEQTLGGGRRLDAAQWAAVQSQLDEQAVALAKLERERDTAKARAEGAAETAAAITRQAQEHASARQGRVALWLSAAGVFIAAISAAGAWLLHP